MGKRKGDWGEGGGVGVVCGELNAEIGTRKETVRTAVPIAPAKTVTRLGKR